ncbi:putative elongator complex protein 1 [Microplitis mediator]|uniref:putative elongator complex protein 1 n=1 Tax=Microplitis mediator TaxID=375433 RepID=UPI0025530874|nr:putative elongator complex protein 1 [Microplitis mediator]XP_057324155.1 putative elongator complex protein 1 [Microplitis mediator]
MRNLTISGHTIGDFRDTLINLQIRQLEEADQERKQGKVPISKSSGTWVPGDVSYCVDPRNDTLFIIDGSHFYIISNTLESMTSLSTKGINDDPEAKPFGMEYWSDNETIYCAYSNGKLLKISLDEQIEIEVAAVMDEGINCMQLSPDQELLVLVTNNHHVFTTTSSLSIMSEVDLMADDFGEKQFVTAGWGHKETQFHGSEGKAAAKAKAVIDPKTDKDSKRSWITWRGDGSLFAVSFFNEKIGARLFKIFNRKGVLQYTSELTHRLEEMIAWKPSGNYIAGTQRLDDKYVVALFEKNGLKHREFTLPFSPADFDVKSLRWSPDSDILVIECKSADDNQQFLQLWTVNNYHWYLKQSIPFTRENPLLYYTWSTAPHAHKRLMVLTKNTFVNYSFRWTINHSRGTSAGDKSVVGVIDGDKILLTGFKMGIVPPPSCHKSLQIDCAINECIFAPSSSDYTDSWVNSNTVFLLLQNSKLALCLYNENESPLEYQHVQTYEIGWDIGVVEHLELLDDDLYNYSLHHFLWFRDDVLLCSMSAGNNFYLCVAMLRFFDEGFDEGRIVIVEALTTDQHIQHIVASPGDVDKTAYLVVDNQVLKYNEDEEEDDISPTEIIIPESCDQMEVVEIEGRHVIVMLGCTNRLYVDGSEVANNITSICVHSDFLLLTTLQHALVCVNMNADGFRKLSMSNLSLKSWGNGQNERNTGGLSMRRLERTSSLVAAIPGDSRVILQMKRGNLETIQPRALNLHILKTHLSCLNYFMAFDIMRKQRINLNLIYDHNPRLFVANAEKFIDDIKNPCWLNLFISELQEEDVTETLYSTCYTEQENENRKSEFDIPEEGKVEKICQLLRKIMERKSGTRNLVQPILTCLVKNKHTPGLEAALRKIKEFKMKEETAEGRQQSGDEALKYLLYLVDVDVLYDIALGMYDLELAKFVASKSLKDPKEYLPYLNNLAELEENYRKFKIDKDLRRYESALDHISKRLDKFDECLDMVCSYDLYAKAIKLFAKDQKEYIEIAKHYGEHLMRNKRYREAGVMFQRCGNLDRALQVHKIAGSWQDAIIVSTKMKMSPGELNVLYGDLVTQLRDDKRYRDAADISLTYLEHIEEAVSLLCEGKEWRDALRIAHTHKRLDLIETHVKPGSHEHAIDIYFRINKNKEEFMKFKRRLLIVRKEKAKKQALAFETLEEERGNAGRDVSDLLSETTSVAGSTVSASSRSSRSSARSYRSGKNKRKHERKILDIKEGSAYEDLGLVRALHIIITNTYAQRDEVNAVNRVLLHLFLDELAEKLQNALMDMITLIEKSKHEIWVKNVDPGSDDDPFKSQQNLLEPKFTYPPDAGSSQWILDIFPQSIKNITL